MSMGFHPGTLDLLGLRYEPISTLPGLVVARYRVLPDPTSRHWVSLAARSPHRCGVAGALAERSDFLIMTAISKASYWCHTGRWRAPNISVPVDATQLCEHSALPRQLARAMGASNVRARHLTIEVLAHPNVPVEFAATTLGRLHDLGVRISYEPAVAPDDYSEFAFDEIRVGFGSRAVVANHLANEGSNETRQSLLATGVTTGDHLMAALSAGATHIDGAFAGLVRSDRSSLGVATRHDRAYACL